MIKYLTFFFTLFSIQAFASGEITIKGKVVRVGQCHITVKHSSKKHASFLRKFAPKNAKRGARITLKLKSPRDFFEARAGGEFFARKLAMPGGTGISRKLQMPGGTGISKCDLNRKKFISLIPTNTGIKSLLSASIKPDNK